MELPDHTDVRTMTQYRTTFLDEVDKYTIILDSSNVSSPGLSFEPIVADDEKTARTGREGS